MAKDKVQAAGADAAATATPDASTKAAGALKP